MRKEIFAICDPDREYAESFAGYIIQRKMLPFAISAFTSSSTLLEFGKDKKIDLLLINPELLTREVRELSLGTLVLLTDGEAPQAGEGLPCVNKFQACPEVIRRTMEHYDGEENRGGTVSTVKKKAELIGVHSPVNRCGKTIFALTLAQLLGRTAKTLYINMETYSGFDTLFGRKFARTITDLLYYSGRDDDGDGSGLVRRAAGIIEKAGRFDFLPPAALPWDIRGVSLTEIRSLITAFAEQSEYEYLVLDIGNEVEDVLRILEKCTRIYMPVAPDLFSRAKIAQFEEAAREWANNDFMSRVVRVKPPCVVPEESGPGFIDRLEYTEMGVYIKQLLANKEKKSGG